MKFKSYCETLALETTCEVLYISRQLYDTHSNFPIPIAPQIPGHMITMFEE